ncbi:hypothetical protein H4R35_004378 [Dimargaris xerosporica]|nr:hypothetical protein H4R35_004378 [Dimargaris xerosporica]
MGNISALQAIVKNHRMRQLFPWVGAFHSLALPLPAPSQSLQQIYGAVAERLPQELMLAIICYLDPPSLMVFKRASAKYNAVCSRLIKRSGGLAHMIVQQAMATPAERSIAYHLRPIPTKEGWCRLLLAVESEVHTFLADLAYYKLQYAIPTVKVNDQTFKRWVCRLSPEFDSQAYGEALKQIGLGTVDVVIQRLPPPLKTKLFPLTVAIQNGRLADVQGYLDQFQYYATTDHDLVAHLHAVLPTPYTELVPECLQLSDDALCTNLRHFLRENLVPGLVALFVVEEQLNDLDTLLQQLDWEYSVASYYLLAAMLAAELQLTGYDRFIQRLSQHQHLGNAPLLVNCALVLGLARAHSELMRLLGAHELRSVDTARCRHKLHWYAPQFSITPDHQLAVRMATTHLEKRLGSDFALIDVHEPTASVGLWSLLTSWASQFSWAPAS